MQTITPIKILSLTTLVILYALIVRSWNLPWYGGFGEKTVATYYSIFLLALTAWICLGTARRVAQEDRQESSTETLVWAFIGVSFVFLALDEGLRIHENLDRLIHKLFGITETALTDRLGDMILLIYWCIGLWVLTRFRAMLFQSAKARRYIFLAVSLFVVSMTLDTLNNRAEYLDWFALEGEARTNMRKYAIRIEEIFKLLTGTLLLLGFTEASRSTRHGHS